MAASKLQLHVSLLPDKLSTKFLQLKNCSVHPHLKKPSLDKENLANYRPISHLSYLSKLTERIVKARLTEHSSNLSYNNRLNPVQSAHIKAL